MKLKKVICVTGRFQKIHYGHVNYLELAQELQNINDIELFILTGPHDSQLDSQNCLEFAKRRVLLSTISGINKNNILNQYGTPHGSQEEKMKWATNFFIPLISELEKREREQLSLQIILATVKKKDDMKFCLPNGKVGHYTDFLKLHCCNDINTVDLSGKLSKKTSSLSSRNIDNVSNIQPAASYAASMLPSYCSINLFEEVVKETHFKFGLREYNAQSLNYMLRKYVPDL